MKILWVKTGPLFPPNTGGRRRTHAMLNRLAKLHDITYLALLPVDEKLDSEEESAPYSREKVWIPSKVSEKGGLRFFAEILQNYLASKTPYVLDRYFEPKLVQKLIDFDQSGEFDLIVCDFLSPAVNFEFSKLKTPTMLFQHNIEAQIWKRLAAEKTNPLSKFYFRGQHRRMVQAEKSLSEKFDSVVTVSDTDSEHCRVEYQLENVLGHVPTGVDAEFFSPPPTRNPKRGLIGFLGSMDWMPNVECVQYFAAEIFPAIQKQIPEAQFRIIGRNPTPAVQRLAEMSEAIELTGTVDDVRPHLDDCAVLVVPLRSGGGTRIKMFEAMAQGVPVVSTTIGAEGLPVRDGLEILIADDSASFADATIKILASDEVARSLSENARRLVVERHSWEHVADVFARYCQDSIKKKESKPN